MNYDQWKESPYAEQGEWEDALEARAEELLRDLRDQLRAGTHGSYATDYIQWLGDNVDTEDMQWEWCTDEAVRELTPQPKIRRSRA